MDRPDGTDPRCGGETNPGGPEPVRTTTGTSTAIPPARARWSLALGGLAAGLAAFALGEATYSLIPADRATFNTMGTMVTAATAETTAVAEVRNAALAFGLLGLCLGGSLGIAGGLAAKSATRAAMAGLLGAILGAAPAVVVSLSLLPYLMRTRLAHVDLEIILSIMTHGLIWGLAGAAAGLAFAVGLGQGRGAGRAMIGGLVGAVAGAIAYDMIGAVLFPLALTGEPVSITATTRLLARLLIGVGTSAGVLLFLPPSLPPAESDPGVTLAPRDAASDA